VKKFLAIVAILSLVACADAGPLFGRRSSGGCASGSCAAPQASVQAVPQQLPPPRLVEAAPVQGVFLHLHTHQRQGFFAKFKARRASGGCQ
jgi:hypothetical protein